MENKHVEKIKNSIKNFIAQIKYLQFILNNKEYKKILNKNSKFLNSHMGERCFILGNGPSLKNFDLSQLSNEFTFSVNQLMRRDDFFALKPNIHFWADENFFIGDSNEEEIKELISVMKKINDTNAHVFYPIRGKSFIEKNNIYNKEKNYFHYSKLRMSYNYKGKIDFTKNTFGFGTVVQWCITLAIYMGFKEIYLLGCDNTAIMACFNSFLMEESENDYAYKINKNERLRMAKIVELSTMENTINAHLMTLKDYRILQKLCEYKNIKIINCSEKTLIDSIERKKIVDVL